jgi:hypothetical protein
MSDVESQGHETSGGLGQTPLMQFIAGNRGQSTEKRGLKRF